MDDEELIFVDHGIEIAHAPERLRVSLQRLVGADPRLMFAVGNTLFVGDYMYEVVGYDYERHSLLLRKDNTL